MVSNIGGVRGPMALPLSPTRPGGNGTYFGGTMFSWPNWLYRLWALFLRSILVPLSLPVRAVEWLTGNTFPRNNIERYKV